MPPWLAVENVLDLNSPDALKMHFWSIVHMWFNQIDIRQKKMCMIRQLRLDDTLMLLNTKSQSQDFVTDKVNIITIICKKPPENWNLVKRWSADPEWLRNKKTEHWRCTRSYPEHHEGLWIAAEQDRAPQSKIKQYSAPRRRT